MLSHEGYISENEIEVSKGDKVFVVGCGNTAIDAARTALRLGASKVEILYHRTIDRMAALHAEYEDALKEGVTFRWNASIVEICVDEDRQMKRIIVEIVDPESGEKERISLDADKVLTAVGAVPSTKISRTSSGIEVDEKGFITTRENPYGMTTRRGVFAGGDVANRQATVVHAMRDAKMVAEGIARYVDAVKLMASLDV